MDPEHDHWAGIPKPWFQLNLSGFDSEFELILIGFQNTGKQYAFRPCPWVDAPSSGHAPGWQGRRHAPDALYLAGQGSKLQAFRSFGGRRLVTHRFSSAGSRVCLFRQLTTASWTPVYKSHCQARVGVWGVMKCRQGSWWEGSVIGRTLAESQRRQFKAQDCPSRGASLDLGESTPRLVLLLRVPCEAYNSPEKRGCYQYC